MVIFHSYVKLPEGMILSDIVGDPMVSTYIGFHTFPDNCDQSCCRQRLVESETREMNVPGMISACESIYFTLAVIHELSAGRLGPFIDSRVHVVTACLRFPTGEVNQ